MPSSSAPAGKPSKSDPKSTGVSVRRSRPTGLGLLFLLSLTHEISQARTEPSRIETLRDFLETPPEQLQGLLDMLVEAYPELADRLVTEGESGSVEPEELARQLAELEADGFLESEETQRLLASLRSMQAMQAADEEQSVQLVQSDSGDIPASDAGGGASAAGEAGAVDIGTLPPPGAGPAFLAVGPALVGVGAALGFAATDPQGITPLALPSVDPVTGNNVVTLAEKSAGVTVGGNAQTGSSVSVTWGTVTKTTVADNAGHYSVIFAPGDLPPAGGNTTISVTATDGAGQASPVTTQAVTVNVALTNVLASNLLADGAPNYVESITLQAAQVVHLTLADYQAGSAILAKVTNAPADYQLVLDLPSASEPADIAWQASHGNPGGIVDQLDLSDNSTTLTDAQASALVAAGLQFAADDTGVDVQANTQASGTQLGTSLSDLQKLGVDTVSFGTNTGINTVALGVGSVDFAQLPVVSTGPGANAALELSSADAALLNSTNASDIKAAGFDIISGAGATLTVDSGVVDVVHGANLQFNAADQVTVDVASIDESGVLTNLISRIDAATYTHDLDVLDLADNGVSLTDAQASSLVNAGLQFAADDTGVALEHAAGTHLNTSLSDLQTLGVDVVHTASGADLLSVDFGSGPSVGNNLPVFDAVDQVRLVVDETQVSSAAAFFSSYSGVNPNIDTISVVLSNAIGGVELSGFGVLDPAFSGHGLAIGLNVASSLSDVTLGMILEAADGSADPLATLTGTSLANALVAAGINDISIDAITSFKVADFDLKPLMDAGLIRADGAAEVTVTNADGSLDVTLAQLAAIGADHVQATTGSLTLDAGVSFTSDAQLESSLANLISEYEAQAGGLVSGVFASADAVNLTVDGTVGGSLSVGYQLDAALWAKLQLLGIDDVLDDNGNSIK